MAAKNLFSGAKFAGEAEGDRQIYYVFETDRNYLVAAPMSPNSYSVTLITRDAPELVSHKFKGKHITANMLKTLIPRSRSFSRYFDRLNTLYAMVGLGKAKKLKKRLGRAMLFKVK
jgi:hypothetical protein